MANLLVRNQTTLKMGDIRKGVARIILNFLNQNTEETKLKDNRTWIILKRSALRGLAMLRISSSRRRVRSVATFSPGGTLTCPAILCHLDTPTTVR
jgi:hypothetical protein